MSLSSEFKDKNTSSHFDENQNNNEIIWMKCAYKFTFYSTAIHHWNSLPNEIKSISDFNLFKKLVQKHLVDHTFIGYWAGLIVFCLSCSLISSVLPFSFVIFFILFFLFSWCKGSQWKSFLLKLFGLSLVLLLSFMFCSAILCNIFAHSVIQFWCFLKAYSLMLNRGHSQNFQNLNFLHISVALL